MIFVANLDAINHVTDDDLSALHIRYIVVWIVFTILIFNKIEWITRLSYIVIHSSCANKQRITTYIIYNLLAKIGNLHNVLKRARCFRSQFPQQRAVSITQLKQRQIGDEAENAFKQERQRQREHGKEGIAGINHHRTQAKRIKISVKNQRHAGVNHQICQEHRYGSAEIARTTGAFCHTKNSDKRHQQLNEEILERIRHS